MSISRTLGAACAVAALLGMSGAAFADGGYTRTYGKDKVEIYVQVKSGAYADVDYVTHHKPNNIPIGTLEVTPPPKYPPHKKQEIKEETAKAWGEIKKVKIEAQGTTHGTFDVGYSSSASTHSKTESSGGPNGGPHSASSSNGPGGGGCGCSDSSSTTSASAGGHASGSWSTGN